MTVSDGEGGWERVREGEGVGEGGCGREVEGGGGRVRKGEGGSKWGWRVSEGGRRREGEGVGG